MTSRQLHLKVRKAIRIFWRTRQKQTQTQGSSTGIKDTGNRKAVTGGKHLDGFVALCHEIAIDAGLSDAEVFWKGKKCLPGFYRAEKDWDIVIRSGTELIAIIEFKAQVGSFGNNCNNRIEEALGNATDLWAAYREGIFKPSARPWLGYVFLLEDNEKAHKPVKVYESHYQVYPEFIGASYAKRYQIMMEKLLRERLYDGACLILSSSDSGINGGYSCPSPETDFEKFAIGLRAQIMARIK